jgi:hypothetical protein
MRRAMKNQYASKPSIVLIEEQFRHCRRQRSSRSNWACGRSDGLGVVQGGRCIGAFLRLRFVERWLRGDKEDVCCLKCDFKSVRECEATEVSGSKGSLRSCTLFHHVRHELDVKSSAIDHRD